MPVERPARATSMRFAEFNAAFQPISGIKLCKTSLGTSAGTARAQRGVPGKPWRTQRGAQRKSATQARSARPPDNADLSAKRTKQAYQGSYCGEKYLLLRPKLMIWKERQCPPFLAH